MKHATATAAPPRGGVPGAGGQYLTFTLGGDVYGIDILNIREIIGYGSVTPVPMMPESIAGVINLRGSVVPVVDLAWRFARRRTSVTKRTSIVIVEVGAEEERTEVGVIVDTVNEVLDIPGEAVTRAPAFGANIRADFIAGMGKVDGELLILLDVNHVLSVEELSMLQEVAEEAQLPSSAAGVP